MRFAPDGYTSMHLLVRDLLTGRVLRNQIVAADVPAWLGWLENQAELVPAECCSGMQDRQHCNAMGSETSCREVRFVQLIPAVSVSLAPPDSESKEGGGGPLEQQMLGLLWTWILSDASSSGPSSSSSSSSSSSFPSDGSIPMSGFTLGPAYPAISPYPTPGHFGVATASPGLPSTSPPPSPGNSGKRGLDARDLSTVVAVGIILALALAGAGAVWWWELPRTGWGPRLAEGDEDEDEYDDEHRSSLELRLMQRDTSGAAA